MDTKAASSPPSPTPLLPAPSLDDIESSRAPGGGGEDGGAAPPPIRVEIVIAVDEVGLMGEGRLVPYRFKASGQMRAAHAMVARGTTVMGRASAVAMGGRPPGATPIVLTATPSTRYSHRARDVVECRPDGVYKHALVAHSVGEVFALCSAPVLYVIGGWATVHAFMPYASAVHRFVLQDVVPTEPTPHAPHFHFDPRPPPQLLNIEAGLIVEEYRGSPYRLETWHLAPERLPPPPRSRSAIRSRRLAAPRGKRAMRRVRPSSTPPIPDDDPLYYRWAPSALGPALSRAHRPTTAQAAHPPSSSSLSTAFDAAFEADLERAIRQSLEEAGMVDVDLVGVDSDSPLMDWTVVENHDATDARPTRRSPPPSDALFALNVRCKVIIAGIQHDLRDAQDRSSYIGRPPLGCLVERTARVDRAITWNVVRHLRPVDVLCLARASPYVPRILAEIADSLWASREMDPRDDAPPWRAVVSTVERGHVRPRGATRRGLAVARAWLRVVVMAGVEAPDRPIGASLPRYRGTRASATDAYHNKYVLAAACAARVGCDRVLYECVESSIRSNGYNDRSLPALSMARAGGTMRSAVALGVACGIAEYNASAMRHFYDADDDSVAMEMGERAGAPAERFVQAVLATVTLGIVCSLAPPAPGAPSGVIRGAKRSGADVPSSASLWTNDAAFYVEAAGHLEGTMRLLVEGASVRRGLVDECGPAALRMARLVAGALEDLSATPPPSRSSRKAQRTATIWRRRVGDALECIGTLASTMKRILAPTDEGPDVHARLSSRAQRHILEEIDLMTALAQHEPDLVFGDMIPHLSVTDRVALASTNRCMLLMVAEHARRAAVPRNRPVSDAHERACRMWDEVVESVPLIAAHDETGVEPVRRAIATVILRLCVLPLVEGLVHSVERATNGACGSVATMPCSTEPLYANTIRVPERLIAALVHSVYTRDRDGIGRCADASHRLGRCIDRLWEHAHPTTTRWSDAVFSMTLWMGECLSWSSPHGARTTVRKALFSRTRTIDHWAPWPALAYVAGRTRRFDMLAAAARWATRDATHVLPFFVTPYGHVDVTPTEWDADRDGIVPRRWVCLLAAAVGACHSAQPSTVQCAWAQCDRDDRTFALLLVTLAQESITEGDDGGDASARRSDILVDWFGQLYRSSGLAESGATPLG